MSPRTVVTLLLAGCAVTSFAGCRNLLQPCGPTLVVTASPRGELPRKVQPGESTTLPSPASARFPPTMW